MSSRRYPALLGRKRTLSLQGPCLWQLSLYNLHSAVWNGRGNWSFGVTHARPEPCLCSPQSYDPRSAPIGARMDGERSVCSASQHGSQRPFPPFPCSGEGLGRCEAVKQAALSQVLPSLEAGERLARAP